MGHSFPSNVDRDLIQSLELQGTSPNFDWAQVARVIVSLDWNFQQNKLPSFQEALMTAKTETKVCKTFRSRNLADDNCPAGLVLLWSSASRGSNQ